MKLRNNLFKTHLSDLFLKILIDACTSRSFSQETYFQSKYKRQKNNVRNMLKADYKNKNVNDIVLTHQKPLAT